MNATLGDILRVTLRDILRDALGDITIQIMLLMSKPFPSYTIRKAIQILTFLIHLRAIGRFYNHAAAIVILHCHIDAACRLIGGICISKNLKTNGKLRAGDWAFPCLASNALISNH